MLTNEATHLPPPTTVWEWLGRDTRSPLHRIYRLQSALLALSLALGNEDATHGANLDHLRSFAENAFSDCEDIGEAMEMYLMDVPYFSTIKQCQKQ